MSADAPTPTTKREVLIAREAFERGVAAVWSHMNLSYGMESTRGWKGSFLLAAEAYPLPTVTRPRTITVPEHSIDGEHYEETTFRAMNRRIEWRVGPDRWMLGNFHATAPRVAAWQDLLNNPTETVEDDTP